MRILVTNDDGIYARGLWSLVAELKKVGQVIAVAPDREQSAVGTSVTLHHPLRVAKVAPLVEGIETYSVEGTPADSVILALRTLIKDGVDLVVSGINEGSNLGNDVLISGTVGAALQGYFHGLPSLAISVTAIEKVHFDAAARLALLLVQRIKARSLPTRALLNVNVPNLPLKEIRGIEVTRLAGRTYTDNIKEGHDGKRRYYWIVRGDPVWDEEQGTDIWAVRQAKVSITPLESNLTSLREVPSLHALCPALFQELHSA